MDLRAYYKAIRDAETGLNGDHFVVVSLATAEGGKAGVMTQASRANAARLMTEGRARIATPEEAETFHKSNRAGKDKHDREEAARRIQVMVIQPSDVERQDPETQRGETQGGPKQKDRA